MRHINTMQIDSHVWKLVVTDGYSVEWTARLDGSTLEIFRGDRDGGKPAGTARSVKNGDDGRESSAIGRAIQLVFNWAQMGSQCNEELDPLWVPTDCNLIHHVPSMTYPSGNR